MPVIYYDFDIIYGDVFESAVINKTSVEYLLSKKRKTIQLPSPSGLFPIFRKSSFFNFIQFCDYGNYSMVINKQYYLPKCIICYDNADFKYPKAIYIIVLIEEEIELRKLKFHPGMQRIDIANLHAPVISTAIIKKMENTIKMAIRLIQEGKV